MLRCCLLTFFFSVTAVMAAPSAHAKVIDRVVAVVNDEIILDSELEQWTAAQMHAQDRDRRRRHAGDPAGLA